MASNPGDAGDRRRTYAEWYVWAARNLTSTVEIRHACAEAATEALATGGDPAAAARSAAQNRSGPGWTTRAEPVIRSYAEWYDWARTTLNLTGEPLHTAAAAAIAAMEAGGDGTAASEAARRAAGEAPGPSAAPPAPAETGGWAPPPGVVSQPAPPPPPPPTAPPPPPAPPSYQPAGFPPAPAPYQYGGPAYTGPPPAAPAGSVQVPVWASVLLGVGCGISLLLAVVYALVLTDRTNTADVVLGSILFGGIGLVMFVCSLVALIGIIRRAAWARVMAIIAGAAFCLSCVGILLGVPVIIGAATARRSLERVY